MPGDKTHEQQLRTFERKDDVPKGGEEDHHPEEAHARAPRDLDARQSEMPVSRQGMHQESRQHNNPRPDPAKK